MKIRVKKGFSQRQAAVEIGVTQSYLAQVEMGYRPISGKCLEKLERLFKTKFGKLWGGIGRRGRPSAAPATREALRELGQAIREFWNGEVLVPEHPQPHQVRTLEDPLWTIALRLGEEAGEEVRRLEALRAKDEAFWRQFNELRFDSWCEKRLLVRVALLGMPLMGVRLERLGCKVAAIDGVSGEKAGLHRGFVMRGETASLVWCPQVTIRTGVGYRCVDNLLVISGGGKSVTLAVELDGAPFHGDARKEQRRDRELGIPVLHVDAARLDEPGLIASILRWAKAMLEAAGSTDKGTALVCQN
ncbi:MAG: helix-turn-helix transcriptional regulator [Candidatus Eremiobacteraeota bacterium]|nr:helix-turn-helix transcriptional regulator [Candidatus Eremiobacteraeota bacterium]